MFDTFDDAEESNLLTKRARPSTEVIQGSAQEGRNALVRSAEHIVVERRQRSRPRAPGRLVETEKEPVAQTGTGSGVITLSEPTIRRQVVGRKEGSPLEREGDEPDTVSEVVEPAQPP